MTGSYALLLGTEILMPFYRRGGLKKPLFHRMTDYTYMCDLLHVN